MPPLITVILVVQNDQTLNNGADQEAHTCKIHLPSNGGKPAYTGPLALVDKQVSEYSPER